ncbi:MULTISPECIES: hypothetical protein [Streptomyces]|uniref:Uncharacterized protein n=2 Tax=Streptomyces TaxID=1883 RepID=A0ABV9IM24_9ACTN
MATLCFAASPKVTWLHVEATFDDGRTWHRSTTRAAGATTFTTKFQNPGRGKAAKAVGPTDQRDRQQGRHRESDRPQGVHAALTVVAVAAN